MATKVDDELKKQINEFLKEGKAVIVKSKKGLVIKPKTSEDKIVIIERGD